MLERLPAILGSDDTHLRVFGHQTDQVLSKERRKQRNVRKELDQERISIAHPGAAWQTDSNVAEIIQL